MGRDTDGTFLFADIAGFTALTEAHGDERAADLAGAFAREVQSRLAGGGELVKSIGDALMVRLQSSDAAVDLGRDLAAGMAARHGYSGVRVGMHRGPAIRRGSDWFGATVNVAARVTAIAGAGEVLLTESVRAALSGRRRERLEDRGLVRLRNVSEPVHLFALAARLDTPGATVTDPVCQMRLERAAAVVTLQHAGRTVQFCSRECAERFTRHPERYLADTQ